MSENRINGCDVHLSTHDRAVLGRVFSPHLPNCDEDAAIEEQVGPAAAAAASTEEQSTGERLLDADLAVKVKQLELDGVEAAEKGDIAAAEQLFTEVIELAPQRASGYNNRAQARRLLDNVSDAEADLERALELSHGKGAAACQAFTQRALIRSMKGDESGAIADFKVAASLGSQFAKTQLIAMNPYAAMCSAMMTEMMAKIRRGEIEG